MRYRWKYNIDFSLFFIILAIVFQFFFGTGNLIETRGALKGTLKPKLNKNEIIIYYSIKFKIKELFNLRIHI